MQCPVCKTVNLMMSERSGIEIDYCPQCRGVWLDRGELDKIIERAEAPAPSPAQFQPPPVHAPGHSPYANTGHYKKKKKREGFLGELFDFD
jgi:Zn-finger nucleic acid-binding protein